MKQAKISFSIIIVIVIALAIVMSGYLTIVSSIDFAGFTWQDDESFSPCQSGGYTTSAVKEGDALVLRAKSDSRWAQRKISTDITGIDEVLIIYEGYASAYCNVGSSNSGSSIGSTVRGSLGGEVGSGLGIGTTRCPNNGDSVSAAFQANIWKYKNNFDGTWSSLRSIGVGDVFVVESTQQISGNPILEISVNSGGSCADAKGGSAYLKIYNVIRKENAFAVCKADEYLTTDEKGNQICKSLTTIVLNAEEAIRESYDEKLARITAELEAKNAGLTADIEALKQQLAQQQTIEQITALQQQITLLESQLATASDKTAIQTQIDVLRQQQLDSGNMQDQLNALQAELKETKSVLADVQAKDKNVVNTIILQEQFKRPNFLKELWNKFIAWIKGLFS